MAASPGETVARRGAAYQDVLDAPAHQIAEIVRGHLGEGTRRWKTRKR